MIELSCSHLTPQRTSRVTWKFLHNWFSAAVQNGKGVIGDGRDDSAGYDEVVILLHGGSMQESDWNAQYNEGWFGNAAGFKCVFPTTALGGNICSKSIAAPEGGPYWELDDDAAYDISSIQDSAKIYNLRVAPKPQIFKKFVAYWVLAKLPI